MPPAGIPGAGGRRLDNISVLVTRPAHQAGPLMNSLQQAGARAFSFPAIEIQGIQAGDRLRQRLARLDDYALVIFISANAVDYGLRLLEQTGQQMHNRVIAIGRGTAARLEQRGIAVSLQPDTGFNTEALLMAEALQPDRISGQRILIFRGEGGRELLADSLRQRGAEVDYAEVYRRCRPQRDASELLQLWHHEHIQIVTVSSNEALKNLYYIAHNGARDCLLETPLVVPGPRCAELARELGFQTVLTAANATDQAMLETIQQWHTG